MRRVQQQQKSRIRETKNLSTDANISTDTKKILLVWQIRLKSNFFCAAIYTLYELEVSNLIPFHSMTFPQGFQKSTKFGHWTLGSGGKKAFKRSERMKKKRRQLFFAATILHPL